MGLLREDGGDAGIDGKIKREFCRSGCDPAFYGERSRTIGGRATRHFVSEGYPCCRAGIRQPDLHHFAIEQMKKDYLFLLMLILLLIPLGNSIAESDTPEIILENGFYYVVQPNGEKVTIVKEHEPWALNKAKLSPDRQYVVYTTANFLGFECQGRDLFWCKIDGTERTFLHKFELYINDWLWLSKDDRDFLIALSWEGMAWVLDFNKKKLLLSFPGDSVEKIEGAECYKMVGIRFGIRKEREICADSLVQIREQATPQPQVFIDWMGDLVYLSNQRDPIFGYNEVLKCFSPVYDILFPQEKAYYKEIREAFSHRTAYFPAEATSLRRSRIKFSISGMRGEFDLQRKKVEFLDIGGELSLKVFPSPLGRYMAVTKIEPIGTKELIILRKSGTDSWENLLTKKFSKDATISNLEWSKEDETKIYYTLREAEVSKDSCLIDLTKESKK